MNETVAGILEYLFLALLFWWSIQMEGEMMGVIVMALIVAAIYYFPIVRPKRKALADANKRKEEEQDGSNQDRGK